MKKIACPECGTLSVYSVNNPSRPFCSERCKMIDLGAWASEAYRLPEETDHESAPKSIKPQNPDPN